MLQPKIEILQDKKLIGTSLTISLANNRTGEIWKNFMPRRNEITNNLSDDLISMAIYKPNHFIDFKPTNEFEKWAAIEVTDFENVPKNMKTFTLTGGLYAVFAYKGSSTDMRIFQYIFGTWIPKSDYNLDNRPHFEILGEKYKNADPDSEEEIWIPIKKKR
jgi:AraC family transcriptional regulator